MQEQGLFLTFKGRMSEKYSLRTIAGFVFYLLTIITS